MRRGYLAKQGPNRMGSRTQLWTLGPWDFGGRGGGEGEARMGVNIGLPVGRKQEINDGIPDGWSQFYSSNRKGSHLLSLGVRSEKGTEQGEELLLGKGEEAEWGPVTLRVWSNETAIPCPEVTGAVKVDCCGINPVQHSATLVWPWYEVQGNWGCC